MRASYETARIIRAVLAATAVLAVLTACAAPNLNPSGGDLRVEAVKVVIDSRQLFLLGIPVPNEHNFPPAESGLTRSKIVSDVTRALQSEIIPATKGGARPVKLRVGIHTLVHPATGQKFTSTYLNLEAYVDVIDAQTDTPLVSDKKVWSIYGKRSDTMVQEYNTLISRFVAEVKDVLLQ